ncbi:hypothetical protein HHL19_35210 [Streptomyces sp. R302]|uniref:hypothetical protein n=1 Tax=unclassified Streptomyces TaxID=2593676 RepID=UPI00145FAC76|nr:MULTISPECIES: hypothetical protein [unclassified Streptomyces]NML55208.1 hypothetical protein [Streptomyces sp. R301]NML83762.1 hypothetical protein [Streptomyces sp. R302]
MPRPPARARIPAERIDEALMRLPYEQWVLVPKVAAELRELGLPTNCLSLVLREGRRRGVLKTRTEPGQHQAFVMRIHQAPQRPPRT